MSCTSDGGRPGDAGPPYLSQPRRPPLASRLRNRPARAQAAPPLQRRGRSHAPGPRPRSAHACPASPPTTAAEQPLRQAGEGVRGAPGGGCAAPSPAPAPQRLRAPAAAPHRAPPGRGRRRRSCGQEAASRAVPPPPHCGAGEGAAAPRPPAPAPTRASAAAAIFGALHNGQEATPHPARTPPARARGARPAREAAPVSSPEPGASREVHKARHAHQTPASHRDTEIGTREDAHALAEGRRAGSPPHAHRTAAGPETKLVPFFQTLAASHKRPLDLAASADTRPRPSAAPAVPALRPSSLRHGGGAAAAPTVTMSHCRITASMTTVLPPWVTPPLTFTLCRSHQHPHGVISPPPPQNLCQGRHPAARSPPPLPRAPCGPSHQGTTVTLPSAAGPSA